MHHVINTYTHSNAGQYLDLMNMLSLEYPYRTRYIGGQISSVGRDAIEDGDMEHLILTRTLLTNM
jgi:hypothetical protein